MLKFLKIALFAIVSIFLFSGCVNSGYNTHLVTQKYFAEESPNAFYYYPKENKLKLKVDSSQMKERERILSSKIFPITLNEVALYGKKNGYNYMRVKFFAHKEEKYFTVNNLKDLREYISPNIFLVKYKNNREKPLYFSPQFTIIEAEFFKETNINYSMFNIEEYLADFKESDLNEVNL